MLERLINPEQQLDILERLKPNLGRFFEDLVYRQWGLRKEDVRLVDEVGFGLTGIPIYGPELTEEWPHIDIAVIEEKYKGPRLPHPHPKKIIFPGGYNIPASIGEEYKIDVSDLLKGTPSIFSLPTIEVNLLGTQVLVPEPASHVRVFAEETILYYPLWEKGAGYVSEEEKKIRQWFDKLKMIRNVSQKLKRLDVQEAAQEVIEKSIARWSTQKWEWLVN